MVTQPDFDFPYPFWVVEHWKAGPGAVNSPMKGEKRRLNQENK